MLQSLNIFIMISWMTQNISAYLQGTRTPNEEVLV